MRTAKLVAMLVLLAQIPASAAWGKDLCVYFDLFVIAAQNFTIPGKGKCKPLTGVFGLRSTVDSNDFTSAGDLVSGTVCTNTAKTALRIGFTVHPGSIGNGDTGGRAYFGQANIPLPELANGATALRIIEDDGDITTNQSLLPLTSVGPCQLPNLPVP